MNVSDVYAVTAPTVFDPYVHAACPSCGRLLAFWREWAEVPYAVRHGRRTCTACGWRPSERAKQALDAAALQVEREYAGLPRSERA